MSELKPCPFCGGEADTWDGAGPWHVVCTKCGTVGSPCLTEAEAIAAWNIRAERTCKLTDFTEHVIMDEPDIVELSCSHICMVFGKENVPCYCPSCGARVIKSDQDLAQEVGE